MAVAAGMIQIAAIKKQQQAAEAQGYSSGGFTPDGRSDEPVGFVHAGEWVASQKLVKSPKIRPIIEALEYAQRTNTIGSLDAAEARCDFAPNRMRITNRGGVFFITRCIISAAAQQYSNEFGIAFALHDIWKKSVYGRTLTDIKGDDDMVGYFADNITPLIRSVLGSFLSPDDFAVVTTPKRRHKERKLDNVGCGSAMLVQAHHCVHLARHFATLIAIRIAEQLGLPFFEDCALDNQGCGSAILKQVWHCAHLALDFAPSKHRVGTVFTANNIPPHRNIIVFDDFVTTGQTLVSMQNLLVSLGKNCTFFAGINNKL